MQQHQSGRDKDNDYGCNLQFGAQVWFVQYKKMIPEWIGTSGQWQKYNTHEKQQENKV